MIIAMCPFQDRRYATPAVTEIAAVYVGHHGAAPNLSDRDLEVNMYTTHQALICYIVCILYTSILAVYQNSHLCIHILYQS